MTTRTVAAVDLGAESGRVVAASFDGSRLATTVQGRFDTRTVEVDGILRWDVEQLWTDIAEQLTALAASHVVASVGVDGWGVDYALLQANGCLVDLPTSYRDPRQLRAMHRALEMVGAPALHAATGSQVMEINTVFALLADQTETTRLQQADLLLMLPDLFHHRLCGSLVTERTAASTTGCYDLAADAWARSLLDALGISAMLLPAVVAPGTDLGKVTGALADGPLAGTRVVAPAAHDTASAVAGTPAAEPGALYLSCGTWSLMGVERERPLMGLGVLAADLTNEAGPWGSILLQRNAMGLGLLQECRRHWAQEGHRLSYAELVELAAAEPPLRSVVNTNAVEFLTPGNMPARLREYCARHGEPIPETIGAVARCVVDSLALSHRAVAEEIEQLTGKRPPSTRITGGGSQHPLLAQATADATGRPVQCGPVEATALGNAAVQLTALGELTGPQDVRRVIAASAAVRTYEPAGATGSGDVWADGAQRLRRYSTLDADVRRPRDRPSIDAAGGTG